MKEGFRQSMAWLHTWSGLLVGWVLFLVFAGGTSAYFRNEITFWAKPELHAAARHPVPDEQSLAHAIAHLQQNGAQSDRWFINLPTEREPGVRMFWQGPPPKVEPGQKPPRRRFMDVTLDPATGQPMSAARETRGGEFFYRLHFDLHYIPVLWARWIVGFCAMFMLTAIVSGIVTHKRIFKDFFTFRPKKGQRSWLDAHNATAVLALPYHLMITYTGLVTLMFMYMPWAGQAAYKDHGGEQAMFSEVFSAGQGRDAKVAGQPAAMAAFGPLLAQARAQWQGAPVGRVVVNHPNDANATVSFSRQEGLDLSSEQPTMLFNAVSGARLSSSDDEEAQAALETRGVLYGLHIARFSNPLLRGLFFLSGLAGCAMVATGLLLWAVKERQKYAKVLKHGGRIGFGLRLVDGLNIAAIAGLPIAFATFFWANRLVPVGIAQRPAVEIQCFFYAWAAAAVLGLLRPTRRMWQLLLGVGALLFAGIPVVNAVMTPGSGLAVTVPAGLWPVAGLDLVCLALGAALALAAWYARPKAKAAPRPAAKAAATPAAPVGRTVASEGAP